MFLIMNFTENFLLYFDTYKFFAHLMVYELIATNIDIKSCEMKCENKGGILPQDFGMLAIDDIYISGVVRHKYIFYHVSKSSMLFATLF